MEPKQEVHDAYNVMVDEGNRQMAWGVSDVNTWYRNAKGRIARTGRSTSCATGARPARPSPTTTCCAEDRLRARSGPSSPTRPRLRTCSRRTRATSRRDLGTPAPAVRKDELAERAVVRRGRRFDAPLREAVGRGIRVRVERPFLGAAGPEATAVDLMAVRLHLHVVRTVRHPARMRRPRRPENRVLARSKAPQKKLIGLCLPTNRLRNRRAPCASARVRARTAARRRRTSGARRLRRTGSTSTLPPARSLRCTGMSSSPSAP